MIRLGIFNYIADAYDLREGACLPLPGTQTCSYLRLRYQAFNELANNLHRKLERLNWDKAQEVLTANGIITPTRTSFAVLAFEDMFHKRYQWINNQPDPDKKLRAYNITLRDADSPTNAVNLGDMFKWEVAMCVEISAVATYALQRAGIQVEFVAGALADESDDYCHGHAFLAIIQNDSTTLYDPVNPLEICRETGRTTPALYTIKTSDYKEWIRLAQRGEMKALELVSDFDKPKLGGSPRYFTFLRELLTPAAPLIRNSIRQESMAGCGGIPPLMIGGHYLSGQQTTPPTPAPR